MMLRQTFNSIKDYHEVVDMLRDGSLICLSIPLRIIQDEVALIISYHDNDLSIPLRIINSLTEKPIDHL